MGAEAAHALLEAQFALPEVASDGTRILALQAEMAAARAQIDDLYARWAKLGALQKG